MGCASIAAFLTHLATQGGVTVSTQRRAASALVFLFGEILRQRVRPPDEIARPGG
jgi:hypothetical protein